MGLSPGSRLGAYEVVSAIGAGGMGEVYRARDTKLGRDVALKILPGEFAADPDRLARFRREAQVLAALNHPHIATIHGIEDTDHTHALVMELVAGVTLAERLSAAHGALEPDEALRIARQIALALESAHDHGIVHRDLKPANVKVSDDGVVKVLDFGLAKAILPLTGDADDSPTITSPVHTGRGVILGTAAYMSPEQARGKFVDKRADIWAFGVVLHEMLTGRRLFRGESATDVIAQVLTREPDWQALPNSVSPAIRTLLKRCLARDPNNRLRDIGDARLTIDEALAHPDQDPVVVAAPAAPRSLTARAWPIAIAVFVGMAAGVFAGFSLAPSPAAGPVAVTTRTSIALPANQVLAAPGTTTMAISPDGRRLIYKANVAGRNKLFLREMDLGGEVRAIPDADAADSFAFSPDGQSLAFDAGTAGAVLRMPLSGGTPIKICGCSAHMGMFWSSDGYIYFSTLAQKKWSLVRVLASGSNPTPLPMPAEYASKHLTYPAPLPGGRLLVVVRDPTGGAVPSQAIAVYDIQAATLTPLGLRGAAPWYLPTGHLLFGRDSVLYAVRFDAAALTVIGEPVPLVENMTTGEAAGHPDFDFAVANEAGTVVYSAATFTRARVVKFKEDGAPEPVLDAQGFLEIDLSSDGKHLAVTLDPRGIAHPEQGISRRSDLYTRNLTLRDFTRRAYGDVRGVAFLPDSAKVAFGAGSGREWMINVVGDTGTTQETILTLKGQAYSPRPWSFSRDGKRLAFDHNGNLLVMPLDGDRTPQDFQRSRYSQQHPVFSPDGKSVAYDLDNGRGGQADVWVRPYPGPEPAFRVSTEGGSLPRWSPDGRRLYFVDEGGRIMVSDVLPGTLFRASPPRRVPSRVESVRAFAIAPDGTFYAIVNEFPGPHPARAITVVTGWFDEVRHGPGGSQKK